MAYRIVYGPEPRIARRKPERNLRPMLTVSFFLLFLVLVRTYWPAGCDALAALLLPGDRGITEQALQMMADNWKSGEDFGTVFAAFCREILSHAPSY